MKKYVKSFFMFSLIMILSNSIIAMQPVHQEQRKISSRDVINYFVPWDLPPLIGEDRPCSPPEGFFITVPGSNKRVPAFCMTRCVKCKKIVTYNYQDGFPERALCAHLKNKHNIIVVFEDVDPAVIPAARALSGKKRGMQDIEKLRRVTVANLLNPVDPECRERPAKRRKRR